METAMQEHIENVEATTEILEAIGNPPQLIQLLKDCIDDAKRQLAKERQQIEEAFIKGYNQPIVNDDNSEYFEASDYYVKTYNNGSE
jgi:hypothetical protein